MADSTLRGGWPARRFGRRAESRRHRASRRLRRLVIREVEKGFAQIDEGHVLAHDAVGARLEQQLAEHQSRR